jgi:hypothetical protein
VARQRQCSERRIPCVGWVLVGLISASGVGAANPQPVAVQVTFVDPITVTENNALQFGLLDQNLANLDTVIIAPDSSVTDAAGRVEGGTQMAGSLMVTATEGQAITIIVDSIVSGPGYTLSDFVCNYNAGTDAACDGSGYSETLAGTASLQVGATMTGDGTAVEGQANGSFNVTVTYQ